MQAHLPGKKHAVAIRAVQTRAARAVPQQWGQALQGMFGLEECLWRVSMEEGAGQKDTQRKAREVPQRVAELTRHLELQATGINTAMHSHTYQMPY